MFQRLRSFAQPTSYLGLAVIAGIWCAAFFLANLERERAYDDALKRGQNLARVFDEYISRVINAIDDELLVLRKIYAKNPSHFDLTTWLDNKTILGSLTVHFSISDSQGIIKLSSLGPVRSTVDIGNVEAFRTQLNSKSDDLYIGAPVVGHLSGKLSLQLTRRLMKPDGSFAGIIGASLDVAQLEKFYNSIDIGPAGIITLLVSTGLYERAAATTRCRVVSSGNRRRRPNCLSLFGIHRSAVTGIRQPQRSSSKV